MKRRTQREVRRPERCMCVCELWKLIERCIWINEKEKKCTIFRMECMSITQRWSSQSYRIFVENKRKSNNNNNNNIQNNSVMEKRKENRHKTHGTAPRELFTYILIWDFGFVCVSCMCVHFLYVLEIGRLVYILCVVVVVVVATLLSLSFSLSSLVRLVDWTRS